MTKRKRENLKIEFFSITVEGCSGNGKIIKENQLSICKGSWSGHISNSSHLCAPGWGVCSHKEQHLLSLIHWKQATAIRGCYAINAAQDGGRCRECRDTMDTVNMVYKIFYSIKKYISLSSRLRCHNTPSLYMGVGFIINIDELP